MAERQASNAGRRTAGGCAIGLITLVAGVGLGVALTLGILGISWAILLERLARPGQAPAIMVGPTVTPPPRPIQGAAAPGRRFLVTAPLELDTDTRDPDLLVVSRNYDRNTETIAYLSSDTGTVRWESPPLGDSGSSWAIAYGDAIIAVAVEERLLGLRRDTGELAWETALSDSISTSICEQCLQVFGEVVVALPQDGLLQAFSLATGAPRWSHRLQETTRQIVDVGGLVGVPDDLDTSGSASVLLLFAPEDGQAAGQIQPTCTDAGSDYTRGASYYDHIGRDPAGRVLVWLIDTSPPCLVSVDARTHQVVGRTRLEGFQGSELEPDNSRFVGDSLYLSDGRSVVIVAPQGSSVLVEHDDYALKPLGAGDGALLVLAQRTRGSARYELWAIDMASGEQLWDRVLTATDELDGHLDTGTFATRVLGDTVVLVEQQKEPATVIYERLSLRDGVSRVRAPLAVNDPSSYLRGAIWGRERAFLAIDELYTVELATGRTLARWP
ncbi:MAG: hypothetical protein OHK0015_30900 [Chloroflexi bacterium OHK40]